MGFISKIWRLSVEEDCGVILDVLEPSFAQYEAPALIT